MWERFLEYGVAFITATTKFLIAAPAAKEMGMSYWETIIVLTLGGITGTLFYFFGASWIMELGRKRRFIKEEKQKKIGKYHPRKVFTRQNKLIVTVKRRFGLYGIGFVTHPFLSVPLGCILCAKFYRNDKVTLPYLLLLVPFWSFVLTSVYFFLRE